MWQGHFQEASGSDYSLGIPTRNLIFSKTISNFEPFSVLFFRNFSLRAEPPQPNRGWAEGAWFIRVSKVPTSGNNQKQRANEASEPCIFQALKVLGKEALETIGGRKPEGSLWSTVFNVHPCAKPLLGSTLLHCSRQTSVWPSWISRQNIEGIEMLHARTMPHNFTILWTKHWMLETYMHATSAVFRTVRMWEIQQHLTCQAF